MLLLLQEQWHPGPAEMNARTPCGFNRSGLHLAWEYIGISLQIKMRAPGSPLKCTLLPCSPAHSHPSALPIPQVLCKGFIFLKQTSVFSSSFHVWSIWASLAVFCPTLAASLKSHRELITCQGEINHFVAASSMRDGRNSSLWLHQQQPHARFRALQLFCITSPTFSLLAAKLRLLLAGISDRICLLFPLPFLPTRMHCD